MNSLARYQPVLLSVLRIVAAYLFLLHGTAKLFGVPHVEMFDGLQLFSLYGLAGVLELVGGLLLLLGLFTECVGNVVNRSSDDFSVLIAAFGDLRKIRLAVDRCHAEERSKPHPEDGSRAAGYECGRTSCDVSGSDLCGDRCCKRLEGSHAVFSGLLTL